MVKVHKSTIGILLGFAVALLPFLALAANVSFTPSTGNNETIITSILCDDEDFYLKIFEPDAQGVSDTCAGWSAGAPDEFQNIVGFTTAGEYKGLLVDQNIGTCDGLTYSECLGEPEFLQDFGTIYTLSYGTTPMSPDNVQIIFGGSLISPVGSILENNFIKILIVLAGIIGLGILIHYVRRWIGHGNSNNMKNN